MTIANQTYFVKMRGRSLGPFPPKRLQQMAQKGQLSRVHMLSVDGEHWQRASEFPELFELVGGEESTAPSAAGSLAGPSAVGPGEPAEDGQRSQPQQAAWFYGDGEETKGPVSVGVLRSLVESKKLTAKDPVWKEGMADWAPLGSLSELAHLIPDAAGTGLSARAPTEEDFANSFETKSILRGSNSWVFFTCIAMYVIAAMLLVAFFAGIVIGARNRDSSLIQSSVAGLVQACVTVTAAVFLNQYSSCVNRYLNFERIEDFNLGLRWLGRFWMLVGISLIFFVVVFFIVVTVTMTTEFTLFGL